MIDIPITLKEELLELLKSAESKQFSRNRFRDHVSQFLDTRDLPSDVREAAFTCAVEAGARSPILGPDSAEAEQLSTAIHTLRSSAARARASAWYDAVHDQWPSPIAHELEILLKAMDGTLQPNANIASPDTALFQLRDAFEVLIKFSAIVLLCVLIESDDNEVDNEDKIWARRQMFRSRMSLGHWIENLRESGKRVSGRKDLAQVGGRFAVACVKYLAPAADQFCAVRNNVIGHGSRALDPAETANLVAGCTETGVLKASFREGPRHIQPLFPLMKTLVENEAFAGLDLQLRPPDGSTISLSGFQAAHNWLDAHHHPESHGPVYPVSAQLGLDSRLNLSPFIAARICDRCGRRDIIFFDTLSSPEKGGAFDLLDPARGHKARYRSHEARDIADIFQGVHIDPVPVSAGALRTDQSVIEALDSARVDRNYFSPSYLRQALKEFLEKQPNGVFWLQAPAHVGKTTFVQGLSAAEIQEEPITAAFAGLGGGRVFPYFVRKEIRTGISGLLNTLDRLFRSSFSSDQTSHDQPDYRELLRQPTPAGFVAWLQQWREFGVSKRQLNSGAPILVAIDGLDEAEPPDAGVPNLAPFTVMTFADRSPLILLPRSDTLPDGIYLLLTSRPPSGTDDVPKFLKSYVETLYGGSE